MVRFESEVSLSYSLTGIINRPRVGDRQALAISPAPFARADARLARSLRLSLATARSVPTDLLLRAALIGSVRYAHCARRLRSLRSLR